MKKLSICAFLGTAITVAILSPGLTTAVEAKSRIVVVDNDCMNFPDGFGSGVSSGDTIILDTNLTLDSLRIIDKHGIDKVLADLRAQGQRI